MLLMIVDSNCAVADADCDEGRLDVEKDTAAEGKSIHIIFVNQQFK
jgi:hypothetical protein